MEDDEGPPALVDVEKESDSSLTSPFHTDGQEVVRKVPITIITGLPHYM